MNKRTDTSKAVISSLTVARKIGFSAALTPGSSYLVEKNKWSFAPGRRNFHLQTAFRKGFTIGKFELNEACR